MSRTSGNGGVDHRAERDRKRYAPEILESVNAERDDLRQRLDALVKFLEEDGYNANTPNITRYYRTELSSAIDAAKGGE